jgi:signal peptidase II
MRRSNFGLFWPLLVLVTTIDFCTKALAVSRLIPQRLPHDVFGGWLRFTLVYNPGAAFGLNVGQYSRWIFMALTLIALVILGWLYRATRPGDVLRTVSLALVCGGALGNLIDRIRWADGVVDFVDIGFGDARWPTFNLADMAVSVGAFLLAWVLWGEDAEPEAASAANGHATALAAVGESPELH